MIFITLAGSGFVSQHNTQNISSKSVIARKFFRCIVKCKEGHSFQIVTYSPCKVWWKKIR